MRHSVWYSMAPALTLLLGACQGGHSGDTSVVVDNLRSADGLIDATLTMDGDWGSGYRAKVTLTSTSTTPTTSWTVVIALNGSQMTSCDLDSVSPAMPVSGQATVSSKSWNAAVSKTQSQSFGFNGNGSGRPTILSVTQTGATGGGGSGGTTGSGGITGSGGRTGSGGVAGSGGTSGSGGVVGSGGRAGSGGVTGSGGSSTCTPTTYEAETMSNTTGGSTSGGWNIWSNGSIYTTHNFVAGTSTLSVVARGDQVQGAPHMVVSVAGQQIGEIDVPATSWTTYAFTYGASSAGAREIRVAFTNDFNQSGVGDRNLYVDKVIVSCGGSTGSGGATGSGGRIGSGGTSGSGGVAGSGGRTGSGGATGSGGSSAGTCSGYATRFWDCCKPHCGWSGNVPSGVSPMNSCSASNQTLGGYDTGSSCSGGGAYMCYGLAPWAVNSNLAYGYAATSSGDVCGRCYQLSFTGSSFNAGNDPGSRALQGKTLIVQAINIGYDVGNGQFDLLVPGGGVGAFNACSSQWGVSNSDLGAQYGGFLSACKSQLGYNATLEQYKGCITQKCNSVFGTRGLTTLQAGCQWFADWFQAADNPALKYKEVPCPAELANKSGMNRSSRNDINPACGR